MTAKHTTRSQNDRSDQSRARILDAAVLIFAERGLEGARTDSIAEQAGVNKALLYYYFKSKDGLYAAALDHVFEGVRSSSLAVLEKPVSAGERFLMSVLNHFDRVHSNRGFQSLMQQEMMRLHQGEASALSTMVERVFRPLMDKIRAVIAEGIADGELVDVDPVQLRYAAMGANIFYFVSAPLMALIEGVDPLTEEGIAERRRQAMLFLGKTIFVDRREGEATALRVLEMHPMPKPALAEMRREREMFIARKQK